MRVFVTVGSMLPFDRLISAVDMWASENCHAEIFAQIGESTFRPAHVEYANFVSPAEYRKRFASGDIIVSHVGMGTVITASECQKPLLMLPRRMELSEVTSNHQIATAKWLAGRPGIRIIRSEDELAGALSASAPQDGVARIDSGTRTALISTLQKFIFEEPRISKF